MQLMPQLPLITCMLLPDGRLVPLPLLQLTAAASTAAPPQVQPTPASLPRAPSQPRGSDANGSTAHGTSAEAWSKGRGLRGENMRPASCSAMLQEMLVGLNRGPSWEDLRKRKRAEDRPACAKDVSTYNLLDEAVRYAM